MGDGSINCSNIHETHFINAPLFSTLRSSLLSFDGEFHKCIKTEPRKSKVSTHQTYSVIKRALRDVGPDLYETIQLLFTQTIQYYTILFRVIFLVLAFVIWLFVDGQQSGQVFFRLIHTTQAFLQASSQSKREVLKYDKQSSLVVTGCYRLL